MSVNPSGSPVGTFNLQATGTFGVANNQQVIAAPAAGLAIYVQMVTTATTLGAGVNAVSTFHAAGGAAFTLIVNSGALSPQHIFPGGWRLPAATALQIDVATNNVVATVTYTIGPSI